MRHQRKIIAIIAVVVVLVALYLLFTVNPHRSVLDAYRKQLAAQGEKLSVAELAPQVTEAEQTVGWGLTNAINLLGPSLKDFPPSLKFIVPGRGMVSWAQETLPTTDTTNIWEWLRPQISNHQEELGKVRAALQKPDIRYAVNYSAGFSLLLSHLSVLKKAEVWLSAATLLELHDNHLGEAFEDLQASVALVRPLEQEPLEISQLVHISIGQIAMNATWQALHYPKWQDAQWAQLQAEWSATSFFDGTAPAVQMERAEMQINYKELRRSYSNYFSMFTMFNSTGGSLPAPVSFNEFLAHPADNFQPLMNSFRGYPDYWQWKNKWSYDEELYGLHTLTAALDSVRLLQTTGAFVPALKKLDAELPRIDASFTNASNHFTITAGYVMHPYLLKMADTELQRRMLVTAIALKRFQLRSGKYPANLKELVPDFLSEVPKDFMDGRPLRYHPNPDGTFVLYSVGEDGEDNGGDPTPTESPSATSRSWLKGRDAVWPLPASFEDVEAYKKKTLDDLKASHANQPNRN